MNRSFEIVGGFSHLFLTTARSGRKENRPRKVSKFLLRLKVYLLRSVLPMTI
jgi:hypothetical protein